MTMRTLYVFFFITHARRELVQCSITASPTAAWVWQQFVNATPWGRQPRYLVHDRDAVYGRALPAKLASVGVSSVRTPVRAPRANSVAERVIRTIRQECLDHVIVLNEHHLGALLTEFSTYYNKDRPHRTLVMESPIPAVEIASEGPILSRPVLGGLHHVYARAA
jgi:transposase InsO family protein